MAITVSSITIHGTDYPWEIGASSANTGPLNVLTAYATEYCDGSATNGATTSQNAAYLYGKLHAHAGETSPTTISVTPGELILLLYNSGTVATGGGSAGNSGPAGTFGTAVLPLPAGGCDTENLPSNAVAGYNGINLSGTVNTSGTAVTWASGSKFSSGMTGTIWINNVGYTISSVSTASNTALTLSATAGTQTGVAYFYWAASTFIGGIIGAFTDSSGNVVSTFDWSGYKGINPPGAFTLSSVAVSGFNGQYSGTITGGSSAMIGYWFTVAGFTNANNNGTFMCTAATISTVTLLNPNAVAETHAATVQQLSIIELRVPIGATKLSLGVNDTQLYDNTGSFSMTVIRMDGTSSWAGTKYPFGRYPFGASIAPASPADQLASMKSAMAMTCAPIHQDPHNVFSKYVSGQLFPRGGQTVGKSGQIFP